MAPARTGSWRLVTSLLLMTSLIQAGLGFRDAAICQQSCCNCDDVERITCFCPRMKKLELKPGDIPSGVRSVTVSHMSSLTIHEDAVLNLQNLTNFTLHNIGSVVVEHGGMNLDSGNQLYDLTVKDVDILQLDSHALTGRWREDIAWITFEDVRKLGIATRGFSYGPSADGPHVKIRNIETAEVAPEAFDARIKILEMENVRMQACHGWTFDNKTDSVKLNSVTIHEVKALCFHGVGELGGSPDHGVDITSSTLGTVYPQAFSGNITNVKLKKTGVGNVMEHGFQVHVKDFCIEDSKINTLNSNGLSVTFTERFATKKVTIEHLRRDAFKGVQAIQKQDFNRDVDMEDLEVEDAEPGSLSFARCLLVRASDFRIKSSGIERCPTETWTRRLMGMDDRRPPFEDEAEVYDSLRELDTQCDASREPERMLPVEDESCSMEKGHKKGKGRPVAVWRKTDGESHLEKGAKVNVDLRSEEGFTHDHFDDKHTKKSQTETVLNGTRAIEPQDLSREMVIENLEIGDVGPGSLAFRSNNPINPLQGRGEEETSKQGKGDSTSRSGRSADQDSHSFTNLTNAVWKSAGYGSNMAVHDPYDVSYEYDDYWSDEDGISFHEERPRRNILQETPPTETETDGDVNNPWKMAFRATAAVTSLAVTAALVRVVSRNRRKECVHENLDPPADGNGRPTSAV